MKRYKVGERIVIHDMPGCRPELQCDTVTLEQIVHILDGRIPDKDDVGIQNRLHLNLTKDHVY